MELLIMAAGLGNRFGGLKQLEPVGPNGECIVDYSVYDAIRIGCKRVVFIIKKENYDLFREKIGKRIEKYIETEYIFQDINNVPSFVTVPPDRVKPWGTGHALYTAKGHMKDNFILINADDFYGPEAFNDMKNFIKSNKDHNYGIIGYEALKTFGNSGSVKRGVIKVNEDNTLNNITECLIEKENNRIISHNLITNEEVKINNKSLTSMNMLLLNPTIFSYIDDLIVKYFKENLDKLDTWEFFLPDIITGANRDGYDKVKVIPTKSTWYGITYREDLDYVKDMINKLIEQGIYPKKLWK